MRRAVPAVLFPTVVGLFVLGPLPVSAQRLPSGVTPQHYELWFAPDFATDTFAGRATIDLRLEKPSRTITLHAAEIAFGEVRIDSGGRSQPAAVALDEKDETATLIADRELTAGPARLHITYKGILNDKLRGFYLSKANGRKYAVSQMQATDARRAFPCFDEPVYKATFGISLTIDEKDVAISNGRQVSDTPGPGAGKHTLAFERTKPMSTYLVALLVGDFVCREAVSDGTPLRVCSTPDKQGLTRFALEAAVQQLAFFNDYYGIKYPFGKLDVIGIPDFAAGAMENAGAITFREEYLLADPERASLDAKKRIAFVLSHEIAHMWFGDLVTMKWWDDVWLNEGFATWMASKPLAAWKPEWNIELGGVAEMQGALAIDALQATRAIRTKVETPAQINEVFDGIAYEKAAGVLRMVERFVGAEPFRQGVASYLRRFSYGNAAAEDFWNEIARATSKPVDRILESYVDQPGVPVLSVTSSCGGATTTVTIEQERFVGTPAATAPAPQTWTIPVCFKAFPDSPASCHVIAKPKETLQVAGCAAEAFVNAGSVGYYVTAYSPDTVRALSRKARGTLSPAERLGFTADEWWMVRSGRHDIGAFLDLASALAADDTTAVTEALTTRLAYAAAFVVPESGRARFEQWIRSRFRPALERLGLPGAGDDDEQSRRAALLELVGMWGASPDVQKRAGELAGAYVLNPESLPGTLAPIVLRVAAFSGDAALYDQYVARLKALASNPEEYHRFFRALVYFRDPALVQRTLALAMAPEVRTQDGVFLIGGSLSSPWGRDLAWAFVKQNWKAISERFGTFQAIPYIVGALGNFCSAESAADVRQFFATNPMPAAERGLQRSLERIEACAALKKRQSEPLSRWLEATL